MAGVSTHANLLHILLLTLLAAVAPAASRDSCPHAPILEGVALLQVGTVSAIGREAFDQKGHQEVLAPHAEKAAAIRKATHPAALLQAAPLQEEHQLPLQADQQGMLIRQIFMLCVVMYGSIGLLWVFHWKRKGSSALSADGALFYIALLCVSWASTSVGMHVLNKSLVSYLEAPALISAAQMALAVFVMGATSGHMLWNAPREQIFRWLIVPAFFAAMLCSSFYAYERISLK